MDHAEVRAWLEEAFFRPGALRRQEDSLSGAGLTDGAGSVPPAGADSTEVAVSEHIRGCAACREELRSLHATGVALDVGLGPSPAARARTLDKVRQLGRERRPVSSRAVRDAGPPVLVAQHRRRPPALLAAAAVIALLLLALGSGALLGLNLAGGEEEPDGPRLEQAAVVLARLASAPDAQQIQLRDAADTPAGLLVHSPERQQLAVVSHSLQPPASGRYDCYLQRDGERTFIGPMHFDGETAFWAGPVGEPADAGRSGDLFLVILEGSDEPVLWGEY